MTRNSKTLASFIEYCNNHPEERFWQALRNWVGFAFIVVSDYPPFDQNFGENTVEDTFYWEGKSGNEK